jgi:hypothetical protein
MHKVAKGALIGGSVGAGIATAQGLKSEEPTSQLLKRAAKAAAEGALVGAAVGLALDRRARRRLQRRVGLAAAETAIHYRRKAQPVLDSAVDRLTSAAEVVAEATRERAADVAEVARERAADVAGTAADVARERGTQLAELAKERALDAAEVTQKRLAASNGQPRLLLLRR